MRRFGGFSFGETYVRRSKRKLHHGGKHGSRLGQHDERRNSQQTVSCQIRLGSPDHAEARQRGCQHMQTCSYVEWGWIAYPAALLVLQGIFFMLVLASLRRTRFCRGPGPQSGRLRPWPSYSGDSRMILDGETWT